MLDLTNFDSLQIGLASPDKIRNEWSHGEVKKPETINYRTLKPEKDGLFCERIFGPTKDWECHCGKYKRVRNKGIVCDRCGVEVTRAKVRRERMGHIELATPISHIWYFKGTPSRMGLLLDLSPRSLEKVLYYANYIVTDPGDTTLQYKQLLEESEYRKYKDEFGTRFTAQMGGEAIQKLLKDIDLEELTESLRKEIAHTTGQRKIRAVKRLDVSESFLKSGNRPEWMVLDVLPVIPPDIRPMVQLDGGRFATSDLNDLYRRVLNRNNRLKRLLDLGAPDIIVRNEKRMLQEAVDALIDNGRRGRPVTGPGNRPLKSLSEMLKGKQGRFRQNLLGKRVDYSGRSVIVVGPRLKISQCGLPKDMALELFKPFIMKELVARGFAHNIKNAKRMVEKARPEVWDVLEEVIQGHPVMLNRAPTLHRLGIQAFQPILVEGKAIQLHPLVCAAFNADFDGDQMAVHVPLSEKAREEARNLLFSTNNVLKPLDGRPVMTLSQDMVLGIYYISMIREEEEPKLHLYGGMDEAIMAYENHEITLQTPIKVRRTIEIDGRPVTRIIDCTLGRLMINEVVPQDLGFCERNTPEDLFKLEIDRILDKSFITKIVERCFEVHGAPETVRMLDDMKNLGFKQACRAGITVGINDVQIPKEKYTIIAEAEELVEEQSDLYRNGLISDEERYQEVINIWNNTTDRVTNALMANMETFNPVYMMAVSGARGGKQQIRQLAGMRGLMANPSGKILELPIKSNFREGLNVQEFFISSHGARKGLADTALRTADSGYLTRRLVDVSQDVIIREEDCGTDRGVVVSALVHEGDTIEKLSDRIDGRVVAENVVDPATGEILAETGDLISKNLAKEIEARGVQSVKIRSVLTCQTRHGVCAKCYGKNLATGRLVEKGESVGTVAAQSIGEPGTQLTMRTFHTGGIAGDDITQGLPRVEELFEARKPKGQAIIADVDGTITFDKTKKRREVTVKPAHDGDEEYSYLVPYGSRLKVAEGDTVLAGQELTEGSANPHDVLRIRGLRGVQEYLIQEVQKVYRMQGVDVNDKHIEVIVRQILKKVRVEDSGDSEYLPGSLVDVLEMEAANRDLEEQGLRPATYKQILLGITKASLVTDSFLSAAAFQETTRVLTEAAIKGKKDPLIGLKENVIIGKLIPAGTGLFEREEAEARWEAEQEELRAQEAMSEEFSEEINEPLNFEEMPVDNPEI